MRRRQLPSACLSVSVCGCSSTSLPFAVCLCVCVCVSLSDAECKHMLRTPLTLSWSLQVWSAKYTHTHTNCHVSLAYTHTNTWNCQIYVCVCVSPPSWVWAKFLSKINIWATKNVPVCGSVAFVCVCVCMRGSKEIWKYVDSTKCRIMWSSPPLQTISLLFASLYSRRLRRKNCSCLSRSRPLFLRECPDVVVVVVVLSLCA